MQAAPERTEMGRSLHRHYLERRGEPRSEIRRRGCFLGVCPRSGECWRRSLSAKGRQRAACTGGRWRTGELAKIPTTDSLWQAKALSDAALWDFATSKTT